MYADQFEIYHGNSNPELSRKICQYLGVDSGKADLKKVKALALEIASA